MIGLLAALGGAAHAFCFSPATVPPDGSVVPPDVVLVLLPFYGYQVCGDEVYLAPEDAPLEHLDLEVRRDGPVSWYTPTEPLTVGRTYELWDREYGTWGRLGSFTVADLPPPTVDPTWTVTREEDCTPDGYSTHVEVDLRAAVTGVFSVEPGGDDLRFYAGLTGGAEATLDVGIGSAAPCVEARFSDVTDTVVWSDTICVPEQPACAAPVPMYAQLRYCDDTSDVRLDVDFVAKSYGRMRITGYRDLGSGDLVESFQADWPIQNAVGLHGLYGVYRTSEQVQVELLDWRGVAVWTGSVSSDQRESCDLVMEPVEGGGCASTRSGPSAWWAVGLSLAALGRRRRR